MVILSGRYYSLVDSSVHVACNYTGFNSTDLLDNLFTIKLMSELSHIVKNLKEVS